MNFYEIVRLLKIGNMLTHIVQLLSLGPFHRANQALLHFRKKETIKFKLTNQTVASFEIT